MRKTIELRSGEIYAYSELRTSNPQTIILIHGAFASSTVFQHGHSYYSQTLSSHDDFATDLKQFAEALSLYRFYLLGWCMGANVAIKFAAQYPDQTQGLLLINPASTKGFRRTKLIKMECKLQKEQGQERR